MPAGFPQKCQTNKQTHTMNVFSCSESHYLTLVLEIHKNWLSPCKWEGHFLDTCNKEKSNHEHNISLEYLTNVVSESRQLKVEHRLFEACIGRLLSVLLPRTQSLCTVMIRLSICILCSSDLIVTGWINRLFICRSHIAQYLPMLASPVNQSVFSLLRKIFLFCCNIGKQSLWYGCLIFMLLFDYVGLDGVN